MNNFSFVLTIYDSDFSNAELEVYNNYDSLLTAYLCYNTKPNPFVQHFSSIIEYDEHIDANVYNSSFKIDNDIFFVIDNLENKSQVENIKHSILEKFNNSKHTIFMSFSFKQNDFILKEFYVYNSSNKEYSFSLKMRIIENTNKNGLLFTVSDFK